MTSKIFRKCFTCSREISYTIEDEQNATEILFYVLMVYGVGQQEKRMIQQAICKECVNHFSDNWKELKELK